jgi:hypothetical protein
MAIPPSPHFAVISLARSFNVDRQHLDGGLRLPRDPTDALSISARFGRQAILGIPFELGLPDRPNLILLDPSTTPDGVEIVVEPRIATYILFLHAVEDRPTVYQPELADFAVDGNELGQHVSDYALVYDDGSGASTPILRRFAIQQLRISYGASSFAASPAVPPLIYPSTTEAHLLRQVADRPAGRGETRHQAGRDRRTIPPVSDSLQEHLWVYALPNRHPEKPIQGIRVRPRDERSIIFGITTTALVDHPLRPGVRQKLRLELPAGLHQNGIGELNSVGPEPDIAIDLGTVISARAALEYDRQCWTGAEPNVQPAPSDRAVIVEYVAHPQAVLHVATGDGAYASVALSSPSDGAAVAIAPIAPAHRPVKVRIVDGATGQPVAARLHFHGQAGEHLPPRGHHRKSNPYWFEDTFAEFSNGLNQYSYVSGECEVDLPLGQSFVEIRRGYETTPIRTTVDVAPETDQLTFTLERTLDWRARGWVSADTHVHFLSPQTALLEGAGEDVNVVNLLASQWGEMFSNVGDFDGRTVLGARDFGGDGEFLVRVGTENRMQVLGHISLLGYSGPMIHPLCTGGPSESAIGDPQEVTMAEWAERCIAQGGLVVMPHAPNPQCERAADIVLELVHAVELMTFNPFDAQINPYGIADWYRYLNLGYRLPVVGGSDKMAAASLLGGIRTYAHLGDQPFTYEHWMDAIKAGNTFVTVGPLVELLVDGHPPGHQISLPPTGGALDVTWRVASTSLPIERVELIVGGLVAEQIGVDRQLRAAGQTTLTLKESSWIALRVRGSYRGQHGEIAAHSSAVQVRVGSKPVFVERDAITVLDQIEGAIAYVDTLAPRPEAQRYKQLRATLESAHNKLHQQLHQQGVYHRHASLHSATEPHEH